MQLYALLNNQPVLAARARRQIDYLCPECGDLVRVRGGLHRQPHFFHVKPRIACRQQGKSLSHLHVQLYLINLLPKGDTALEKPFPEIGRIADVVWESERLVFEIQCSTISLQEAKNRCNDYQSQDYTCIWILHEKKFNKINLTAVEVFLRSRTCYFTNFNEKGHGEIYDQFDVCKNPRRVFKGARLKVNLSKPLPMKYKKNYGVRAIQHRLENWPLHFEGDLLYKFFKRPTDSLKQVEDRYFAKRDPVQAVKNFLYTFYYLSLESLLR